MSASNIKTINGTSILGSGDLTVSGGGSSLSEYAVTITSGGSNTLRVYGTSGITASLSGTTVTVVIPAGGWIQSYELFNNSGAAFGSGCTIVFSYTSNTTFNQGFSTIKPSTVQMLAASGLMYAHRAVPAATDFTNTATATGGVLTHVLTIPAALQAGDLKIIGKF